MTVRRRLRGVVASASIALAAAGCQSVTTPPIGDEPVAPEIVAATENEPSALGRSHLERREFGLAQRQYQVAVERNPGDAASWLGLAAAYDNLARFDLADRAYRQAVAIDGETLEVLNNRGYSFLLRGDGRRALAEFRRALALSPDNPLILNNIRLLELGQRPAGTTRL